MMSRIFLIDLFYVRYILTKKNSLKHINTEKEGTKIHIFLNSRLYALGVINHYMNEKIYVKKERSDLFLEMMRRLSICTFHVQSIKIYIIFI